MIKLYKGGNFNGNIDYRYLEINSNEKFIFLKLVRTNEEQVANNGKKVGKFKNSKSLDQISFGVSPEEAYEIIYAIEQYINGKALGTLEMIHKVGEEKPKVLKFEQVKLNNGSEVVRFSLLNNNIKKGDKSLYLSMNLKKPELYMIKDYLRKKALGMIN